MDSLTLLPCPFCGAAAKLKSKPRLAIPDTTYWVGCKTPNCPGDQVWEKIRAEAAVEAWNRRQSLSQEAVRDEALDLGQFVNAASIGGGDSPHQVVEKLQRAINAAALKREPNAAGWNEKGIADIGVLPGEVDATAGPMDDKELAIEIERYLAPDAIYYQWMPSRADMEQIIAALRRGPEREGFYEKLWKDFVSLQRGDAQGILAKVEAYYRERPPSGEMVLWAWGPNGMVRAGEGSCGYIWYAAAEAEGRKG